MPKVVDGRFSRKRNGHNNSRSYFKRSYGTKLERFKSAGFDNRQFIESVANEQQCFTRAVDKENVKILITYIICRIKEVLMPPKQEAENGQ